MTSREQSEQEYCGYCRRRIAARFTYCVSCDCVLQPRLASLAACLAQAGFGQRMFEAGQNDMAMRYMDTWQPNTEGRGL